jgi:hypothetical protein
MIETIIPTSADDADRAAFKSLDSALRFAFGNQYRADPGTLARFQKRTHRGSEIFEDKLEAAAWAGDIRRRIGTVHPHRLAILFVKYAPRGFPCACRNACCSGWKANEEWRDAIGIVVEAAVLAVPGAMSNRQLRAGIVQKWSGADRVNLGVLAEKCGVHRNTAGTQTKAIRKWLDHLFHAAQDEADLCLRGAPIGATGVNQC